MKLIKGGKQSQLLSDEIIQWLEFQLVKSNKTSLVVGVSGGIDSAVTSALCARTHRKVFCLTMPINQNPDETDRAIAHIKKLQEKYPQVEHKHFDLSETYAQFCKDYGVISKPVSDVYRLSLANSKARLRMITLYMTSGVQNGLVVGTGNKVEDFGVGFFTKYGDGGVDISPIADLMKSEVYSLGRVLKIDKEIMDAPPTDGLWEDGRSDEFQLGATYDELEWAMEYDGSETNDRQKHVLEVYNKHRNNNLHKMVEIPIYKRDK